MAELKTEMITYKLTYLCDACEEGFMEITCQCEKSYLDGYGHLHKCSYCGAKYSFDEIYPKIVYEEKERGG